MPRLKALGVNLSAELRKWLCLLVKSEVWGLERRPDLPGRRLAFRCRKKAYLGHYKKRIFHRRKKDGFFADFEKRVKSLVSLNECRRLVNSYFFVFCPKRVKKGLKINIVSNLP